MRYELVAGALYLMTFLWFVYDAAATGSGAARSSSSAPFVVGGAYLVAMTVWVYGVVNSSGSSDYEWLLPVTALAQFLLGVATGRWWAVVLPALVVLISVPAGYPPITPDNAEPLPIWFGLLFGVIYAEPLVGLGVLARRTYDRRSRPGELSHGR